MAQLSAALDSDLIDTEPQQNEMIELSDGVFTLPPDATTIEVVSGKGWLTMDGEDIILRKGDVIHLEVHHHAALISMLPEHPLRFIVCK